jgi:hypothetical protein
MLTKNDIGYPRAAGGSLVLALTEFRELGEIHFGCS